MKRRSIFTIIKGIVIGFTVFSLITVIKNHIMKEEKNYDEDYDFDEDTEDDYCDDDDFDYDMDDNII